MFVRAADMVIGTAGFGFALAVPTMANDNTALYYSGTGYAGTTTLHNAAGVIAATHNGPYNSGAFANGQVECRLVTAGLRVRYTGTELDRGGQIACLETPHHHTADGLPMYQIQQYDRAVTQPVDRNWKAATWQPVRRGEYEYFVSPYPSANQAGPLVIAITGTPGSTYSVELVLKAEFVGYFVRSKTPTPAYPETVRIIAALGNLKSADWTPYVNGATTAARFLADAYRTIYQPERRMQNRALEW
jgi:hypothetical protein